MSDTTAVAAVRVNGEDERLEAANIAELLESREISPGARGIAVALNGRVVPRAEWAATTLSAGDNIEIVLAKQGG